MLLERILDETYHDNGKLSYRATRAKISKAHEHLYEHRRLHPDGYSWVYVGLAGKWDKNGKQQWVLNYSEMGKVLR